MMCHGSDALGLCMHWEPFSTVPVTTLLLLGMRSRITEGLDSPWLTCILLARESLSDSLQHTHNVEHTPLSGRGHVCPCMSVQAYIRHPCIIFGDSLHVASRIADSLVH